jgi:four helix bundle protein
VSKQISISKNQVTKTYDLEERTFLFANSIRQFIKNLPKNISNIEDAKQLTRSSGSVGANYIEANDALGRKDFFHKIRISRKEAKESRYWLRLVDTNNDEFLDKLRKQLIEEATELINIFSAIIKKAK